MAYTEAVRNVALDSIEVFQVRMHSADPGAAGTTAELGTKTAATFAAASVGERLLSTDVELTGLGAGQAVTHVSLWGSGGTPFLGGFAIAGGSGGTANAAGEYTLLASTTKMTV